MSLARLALRLATIEALRPTAAVRIKNNFPTIAGTHVLDSRIDPIDDFRADEARPIIAVYTENDSAIAGQKRGGAPYFLTVDLCFELSVVVKIAREADPSVFDVMLPQTDAELEASLDLMAAQIGFVLNYGPTGLIWRNVSKSRIHEPHSMVHRTSEEGIRLANRTLTWKVEVNEDQYDFAPFSQATGFDLFPQPLRGFAEALPTDSYAYGVLKGLAAEPSFPGAPIATPLETVTLNVSAAAPDGTLPSAPNLLAEVDNLNPQQE